MSGFLRTLFFLLGLLGVLLLSMVVAGVILLRDSEVAAEKIRGFLLSPEDEAYLASRTRLENEPPRIDPLRLEDEVDRNFRRLADRINEGTVRELVESLTQRERELQERAAYLDQSEAELRLHRAELTRLQRQFDRRRQELSDMLTHLEAERARWAEAKVAEQQELQVLRETEREQWQRVAKRYELMRKPWDLLRELDLDDVAMILALMDGKKAAKILDEATTDPTSRDLPVEIHRRLLRLDVDGLSRDQAVRLARLYDFLRPDKVLEFIGGSSPEEIARIIDLMDLKKGQAVLTALQQIDPDRAIEVQRRLQPDAGGT